MTDLNNFQQCRLGKIGRESVEDMAHRVVELCYAADADRPLVTVYMNSKNDVYAHHDGMFALPPALRVHEDAWRVGVYSAGVKANTLGMPYIAADLRKAAGLPDAKK